MTLLRLILSSFVPVTLPRLPYYPYIPLHIPLHTSLLLSISFSLALMAAFIVLWIHSSPLFCNFLFQLWLLSSMPSTLTLCIIPTPSFATVALLTLILLLYAFRLLLPLLSRRDSLLDVVVLPGFGWDFP